MNRSRQLDIDKFERVYSYVNKWLKAFRKYDRDASGHIEGSSLPMVLHDARFTYVPDHVMLGKSGQMSVEQVIMMCWNVEFFKIKVAGNTIFGRLW